MRNKSTIFGVKDGWKLELYILTQYVYVEDNDASLQAKCLVFHHSTPKAIKGLLESESQILYIFFHQLCVMEK